MSEWVKLKASDGQELSAYVARPEGETKAALVLAQEIFGVNKHIRSVADGYAKDGFLVVAPAIFDRIEPGVDLTYEGGDMKRAFELYGKLDVNLALKDVAAGFEFAKKSGRAVGVIGYCFGGLMAWLSATRGEVEKMQPDAAVAYYPGGVGKFATEEPTCPVMLHFGEKDTHIGKDQIDAVRSAHPDVIIYTYADAGHAFNRDLDPNSHKPAAAKLARERSLAFLTTNLIG